MFEIPILVGGSGVALSYRHIVIVRLPCSMQIDNVYLPWVGNYIVNNLEVKINIYQRFKHQHSHIEFSRSYMFEQW